MNPQKMKWKIRGVIYDCDGVLFDSIEANMRLYNDLCFTVGRSPLREEEIRYVHSHTVYEALQFIFGEEKDQEKRAMEILKQTDWRKYLVYLKMEPYLLQTLNLLKAEGILRAINTNRTTSMKYVVETFGLQAFFERVVTALDVKNPKPHPESIEKIIRELNLDKEETVFVGDSEVDQKTAHSAGIRFVAYKNREIADEVLIEDHLALLNLLQFP